MSLPPITCPSGHLNRGAWNYCGDCGQSLLGVCPNGHQNPESRRYCGECGSPLRGLPDTGGPMEHSAPDTAPVLAHVERDADSPVRGAGATLGTKAVSPEGINAPASATGNWFSRQTPRVQTLIRIALVLPVVFLLPHYSPTAGVFLISVLCFLSVLAVVARGQRRRNKALVVAGITGAVALAAGLLTPLVETRTEPHPPVEMFLAAVVMVFPLGFIAAWSIARRNHAGFWIGLLLGAPVAALGLGLVLPVLLRGSEDPEVFELMLAWGIPTVVGCAVAWCVDLAAANLRRKRSPATVTGKGAQ